MHLQRIKSKIKKILNENHKIRRINFRKNDDNVS